MDLGNDQQQLLTSQKEKQPDLICLLKEVPSTTYKGVLPK